MKKTTITRVIRIYSYLSGRSERGKYGSGFSRTLSDKLFEKYDAKMIAAVDRNPTLQTVSNLFFNRGAGMKVI